MEFDGRDSIVKSNWPIVANQVDILKFRLFILEAHVKQALSVCHVNFRPSKK
jgi:hypothetical protein